MLRDCAVCGNDSADGRAYVLSGAVGIRSNSHPGEDGRKTQAVKVGREGERVRLDGTCICMCWLGERVLYLCKQCGKIGAQWGEGLGSMHLESAMQRALDDISRKRFRKDSGRRTHPRRDISLVNSREPDLSSPSVILPSLKNPKKPGASAEDAGSISPASKWSPPMRSSSLIPVDEVRGLILSDDKEREMALRREDYLRKRLEEGLKGLRSQEDD